MITGKVNGLVTHSRVSLDEFCNTEAFKRYYRTTM